LGVLYVLEAPCLCPSADIFSICDLEFLM
jgi:hypothetical protein